jgi:hypothetical protein
VAAFLFFEGLGGGVASWGRLFIDEVVANIGSDGGLERVSVFLPLR